MPFDRRALSAIPKIRNWILVDRKVKPTMERIYSIVFRASIPRPSFDRNRGSIFTEILITLGVVAISSVGLMLAILFAVKLGIRAQWETLAAELGRSELEIIRHLPFDDLPTQTRGALLGNPQPSVSQLPQGTATLTIEDYNGDPTIRQVSVTVSYTSNQQTHTLEFSTLISQGGLNALND